MHCSQRFSRQDRFPNVKENNKEPIRQLYVPKSELSTTGGPKIIETWVVHEEGSRHMPETFHSGVDGLLMHCSASKLLYCTLCV